jgi:hypothetical protein
MGFFVESIYKPIPESYNNSDITYPSEFLIATKLHKRAFMGNQSQIKRKIK